MSATLSPVPKLQFFDANGAPLVGGKLYSYIAGTTTPLSTYTDSTGTTSNTNPVILDARGEAGVWLADDSFYKLALYTADNVLVWTVDQIASNTTLAALAASGGSALIGYLPSGTGAVATTVQTKLRETVSVKDFGAVGNGVADDTSAIQAAVTFSANKRVYIPSGTYKITSPITGNLTNTVFYGDGATSEITGDVTELWNTGDIQNAVFEDLKFSSTRTGTNINNCLFLVYQKDVDGLTFNRCHFTCGLGGISGIRIQPRINTSDNAHTAKNVWITNCKFVNIGSVAITLLCRYVAGTDPHLAFQNVWIEDNYCYNSGCQLTTTGYEGMFISLDGVGTNFSIARNFIKHLVAAKISLENTGGWINGVIESNVVDASSLNMAPYSCNSTRSTGYIVKNVNIIKNTFISTGSVVLAAQDYCVFSQNNIKTTSSFPIYIRYSNYNKITQNTIDATGVSGGAVQGFLWAQLSSTWNLFENNQAITDGAGGTNFFTCEAGCTNNLAINNYSVSPALNGAQSRYNLRTMADANLDLSVNAAEPNGFQLYSGTLTAQRTVTLNAAVLGKNPVVRNQTGQNLVFTFTGAVNSVTLATATTTTLSYEPASNAIRSYY